MAKKTPTKRKNNARAAAAVKNLAEVLNGNLSSVDGMRRRRMDQLAEDASHMWAAALSTPTVVDAKAKVRDLVLDLFTDGVAISTIVSAAGSTVEFVENLIRDELKGE